MRYLGRSRTAPAPRLLEENPGLELRPSGRVGAVTAAGMERTRLTRCDEHAASGCETRTPNPRPLLQSSPLPAPKMMTSTVTPSVAARIPAIHQPSASASTAWYGLELRHDPCRELRVVREDRGQT